jgi:hypothetical protein
VSSGGEESADELMEAADGSLRRVRVLFFEDSVIFESLLRWVKFSKVDSILFQEWSQHTSRCPKLSVSAMFCWSQLCRSRRYGPLEAKNAFDAIRWLPTARWHWATLVAQRSYLYRANQEMLASVQESDDDNDDYEGETECHAPEAERKWWGTVHEWQGRLIVMAAATVDQPQAIWGKCNVYRTQASRYITHHKREVFTTANVYLSAACRLSSTYNSR